MVYLKESKMEIWVLLKWDSYMILILQKAYSVWKILAKTVNDLLTLLF